MTSPRAYRTTSIDLASFMAAIGYTVHVSRVQGETRATFEVEQTDTLFSDIAGYESGATAPAKRLLNVRSRLFREATAVTKGGAW